MIVSDSKFEELPSLPLAVKDPVATLGATPWKREETAQSATVSRLPVGSPRSSLFESTLLR
jgi:hypothetical protein